MTALSNIGHRRLCNQRIAGSKFEKPTEVVRWLGAVQAQDYLGSLWGIGLRMQSATENVVEQAIADKRIVRTWPMRGTLHFVAADDVRWMLELLTPRVIARSHSRHKQLQLDAAVFARCRKIFVRALSGGKRLARGELYKLLEASRIATANSRGLHILGQLAQEGLICFGPRAGKQPTFILLDEWLPPTKNRPREEALAKLAKRYFTSHGPATLQDFAWWSGLAVSDARIGLELAKTDLIEEVIDSQTYWSSASVCEQGGPASTVCFLPAYDEYTVAYKDRSAMLTSEFVARSGSSFAILGPTIFVGGRAVGLWKRALNKSSGVITTKLFTALNKSEHRALSMAASHYGDFLQHPIVLE